MRFVSCETRGGRAVATPEDVMDWIEKASLEELCASVVWFSVMEGTAHCGWTDHARENLVRHVQEQVRWAIERKRKETK